MESGLPLSAADTVSADWPFFGSVLTNDLRPDSDVDVLVSLADDSRWTLFDLVHKQGRTRRYSGWQVEREAVEKSENYIRRRHILQSEEFVCAAR